MYDNLKNFRSLYYMEVKNIMGTVDVTKSEFNSLFNLLCDVMDTLSSSKSEVYAHIIHKELSYKFCNKSNKLAETFIKLYDKFVVEVGDLSLWVYLENYVYQEEDLFKDEDPY